MLSIWHEYLNPYYYIIWLNPRHICFPILRKDLDFHRHKSSSFLCSTNTGHHDIAEMLLKVALSTNKAKKTIDI
jgi:hypothetical protein